MAERRNPLLIGQAEEIDLLKPEVRAMLNRQGVYLASDSARPGWTVPLVVNTNGLFCVKLDAQLDPTRFLPTVQIAGPFYAPDQEVPLEITDPVLLPSCPFCGGPPTPFVGIPGGGGAAPLQDTYDDDGLAVDAYVFCHECGANGPAHEAILKTRADYQNAEQEGVLLWLDRNSRNRSLYVEGLALALQTYPRPEKYP